MLLLYSYFRDCGHDYGLIHDCGGGDGDHDYVCGHDDHACGHGRDGDRVYDGCDRDGDRDHVHDDDDCDHDHDDDGYDHDHVSSKIVCSITLFLNFYCFTYLYFGLFNYCL